MFFRCNYISWRNYRVYAWIDLPDALVLHIIFKKAPAGIKIALLFIVHSSWRSVSLFILVHHQLSKLIVEKDGSGSVWLIIL